MADEIKDAKDGLVTLLATISGLRVIDYEPDGWKEFPVAIVRFTGRLLDVTLGESTFEGSITVTLLMKHAGDSPETVTAELDKYMEPLGTESIEVAVQADDTWGGNVDDGRLERVENVGWREVFGVLHMGADFVFRFTKGVST